jgi:AcrR family transcriptional regulator
MSPGNLYYHFRNREEIVAAIFDRMEPEFRAALTADVDPPLSPKRFAAFYTKSFDVLWRYRFFFGALVDLLRRDEELAARYGDFQSWALGSLGAIAAQLVADGAMEKPSGAHGLKAVATNTWLIWMNWIRFVQTTKEDGAIAQADLAQGAIQTFDILKPYLAPAFRRAALKHMADTG